MPIWGIYFVLFIFLGFRYTQPWWKNEVRVRQEDVNDSGCSGGKSLPGVPPSLPEHSHKLQWPCRALLPHHPLSHPRSWLQWNLTQNTSQTRPVHTPAPCWGFRAHPTPHIPPSTAPRLPHRHTLQVTPAWAANAAALSEWFLINWLKRNSKGGFMAVVWFLLSPFSKH